MTDAEERPVPEPRVLRIGAPAGAWVLTAVVVGTLLMLGPGTTRTAIVAVALVLDVLLVLGRGLYLRRTGRPLDGPALVQFSAWLWAWWAGTPELLPFGSDQSPIERVLFGLMFTVLTTALLWFAFRPLKPGHHH